MSTTATTSDDQAVKTAVRDLLVTLSGIGKVDIKAGGLPTWIDRAAPKQAYWSVRVVATQEERHTMGHSPTSLEHLTVRLDGWMPLSYEQDSDQTFTDLVSAVRDLLRANTSVSGTALFSALPRSTFDFNAVQSQSRGEVACHHVAILVQATRRIRCSTS